MAQIEVTEESLRTAVDEAVFAQAVTLADKVAGFSAVGPQIEAIVDGIEVSVRVNAFSEADERLLTTLATSMGVALENARLIEDMAAAPDGAKLLVVETVLPNASAGGKGKVKSSSGRLRSNQRPASSFSPIASRKPGLRRAASSASTDASWCRK